MYNRIITITQEGIVMVSANPLNDITSAPQFDSSIMSQQPSIFFKQPSRWSRAIAWGIIAFTGFGVAWASVAEVEKVIPAQGKLEPQEAVKEVQAPVSGVVETVHIQDGVHVKAGDVLLTFDTTTSQAQLNSLETVRQSLRQENEFYRMLINGKLDHNLIQQSIIKLDLPTEVAMLAQNRLELVSEMELYRVQLGQGTNTAHFNSEQLARLDAIEAELKSRTTTVKLEADKLRRNLSQIRVRLADEKAKLVTAQQVLSEIKQRNQLMTNQIQNSLKIEQGILAKLDPLVEEGAVAQLQYERQKQRESEQYQRLVEQESNGKVEYGQQRQLVQTTEAEIKQLQQEQQRLELELSQAQEQVINTQATTQKEVHEKIAFTQQRLAEIDSQVGKLMVENSKQLAELESQISQAKQSLKYHEIKAPKSGIVFDLKAHPGFVANPSQTVLEIVPDDALIAEVFITNKDRGFVKEGMKVDVRIDAFDFSEFGDIKGEIVSLGADALEPDAIYPYYRFPAKIKLDQQYINIKGKKNSLESGMSVSVNIKERKRKVISIVFGSLVKKLDSVKEAK